ncbi:N-formylglutamate amidohydrolase [Elongatibacter sediminis]|uniref:N-formylglutamate amidohydrolase n=1 Tax=Elongatibacter sediminis TaxID=3119006 RepID=A0AAW9RB34_9GAMM
MNHAPNDDPAEDPEPSFAHATECPESGADYPLVEPGDSPPWFHYNTKGSANVLIVADHASPYFPAAMNRLGLAEWVLERHVAWDIGSADLARFLSDRLSAPALLAGFSRLIVDPNRQLHDPTAFIEVSDGIAIPGNQGLSDADKELRIQSFFRPYHDAIERRLDAFDSAGTVPVLLSIHTCTPVFSQVVRPWHVGVMWDRDPRVAVPMIEQLRRVEGVCVGDNEPYSGRHPYDYTIDFHAERRGLPHVGVEVRQDLVGTRAGAKKWAGILGDALETILADPELYRRFDAAGPADLDTARVS